MGMGDVMMGDVMWALLSAGAPLFVTAVTLWWFRSRRRDEIFAGITPGESPGFGEQVRRTRVPGGEWNGAVAPRFTPPDEMTPGLAGTVVDGKAHAVDVSATLIDLAVRGHLRLSAATSSASADQHEWSLERVAPPPSGELLAFEQELLNAVFARGGRVTIGELKQHGFDLTMREAQIGLYREVVGRGWYTRHPLDRNRRLGYVGVPLLLAGVVVGAFGVWRWLAETDGWGILLGAGVGGVVSAMVLLWGGRGRTPRTAEGSAARIQTLAFEKYLATAEANQIRFEEASDIFSRFLPYAVVFGLADRWAKVFAEVAARAHFQGVTEVSFDLSWIDGLDVVSQVGDAVMSAVDVVDIAHAGEVVDVLGSVPHVDLPDLEFLEAIGEGLGGVVDSVSDFASSAAGLLDTASGLGDGCDPGCDF